MEIKDTTLVQNRQIRVFISSTFQDMQGERDYLMKKVFPVLKEKAADRDVTLIPLDLRWGITEQESKTGKVVEICLKEIENTYPFFIGIVGDRYGWCPQKEEIINIEGQYSWLQKDIDSGLSVTEIEMQYGVLRNPHNLNAYFFLKDSGQEVVENADKLSRLKNSIRENGRYPVSSYSSVEDLGAQVEKAFSELIDRLFPTSLENEEDAEIIQHRSVINKLTQYYLPDKDGYAALSDFMQGNDTAFVVDGPSGSGKSALIANWLKIHTELLSKGFLYHSIGSGKTGFDEEAIISRLFSYVESERNAGNERPLVIVDGHWEGLSTEGYGKLMTFIFRRDQLPKVIVCHPDGEDFTDDAKVYHVPEHRGKEYWRGFINSYLSVFCKRLTSDQVEKIVSNPLLWNYTILRSFLDQVISFGSYEVLDNYIERLLNFSSEEEFYTNLIEQLEEQYGTEAVCNVMSVIALAGDGITESAILSLSGLTPLAWSQLYSNMKNLVVSPSGYIKFLPGSFQNALAKRYNLMHPKLKNECNEEVCNPIREKIVEALAEDKSAYAFCETGYQLYRSERYEELRNHCICNYTQYRIKEKTYLAFLGYISDPGSDWPEEMYLTGLALLNQYLPKYLDHLKEHPEDRHILYKLSVIPVYYDALKDDRSADSTELKDILRLAESTKNCLLELQNRYPDHKEVKGSVPDTLEFLLNGLSGLYPEEQLLQNIALLEQEGCQCSDSVKALVSRYQESSRYDQAIALCEKYGDLQNAARSYHLSAKQALLDKDFPRSEAHLYKAIENYTEFAKEKPEMRVSVAREYKNLGVCYQKVGDEQKCTEAYKKAGELFLALSDGDDKSLSEYVRIQYILSHGNKLGSATDRDIINWYVDLALNDDHDVQFLFARMCERGVMMERNIDEAVHWYRLAAEAGNVAAQRKLGLLNYLGRGIPKNREEAIKWYSMAAEQDDSVSQYNLANIYYLDEKPDYQKAYRYYKIVAEKGDKDAQYQLALMFKDGEGVEQSYEKAYEWFSKSAASGDSDSQCELGKMYMRGQGVETDCEQAISLFKKVSKVKDSGHYAEATRFLGILYSRGLGCEKNLVEARMWFKKAAKKGDTAAMGVLAEMYYSGRGGAADLKCAAIWAEKAAEQGLAGAQSRIAQLYAEGKGVEADIEKALFWNAKALEQTADQYGQYHPKTLRIQNCQAWYLYLQGKDYPKALQLAEDVITHLTPDIKPENRACCFDTLGAIKMAMDNKIEAIRAYEECLKLTAEAYGEQDSRVKDLKYKITKIKEDSNGKQ